MKKSAYHFLFFLLLLAACPVFAQEVTKKKGKFTTYHANGTKEASGKVKNYKKQGTWKYWNNEGKLEKTIVFKDDHFHGLYTGYFSDGSISTQGNYVNNLKDGTWNSYYNGGKKASALNYANGLRNGLQEHWYENGQLRERTSYTNEVMNYKYTWYFNGKPRAVETYKNGLPEGTWRTYPDPSESRDSLPSSVDEYAGGLRNGVHLAYANGFRTEEVYYKNGVLDGTLKKWDQTGNLGVSENYVKGLRDGLCKYYDHGKLIREVEYSKGKINGTEKEYYYGNNLTKQSWFKNGILDSAYTYFPNGKTESTRIYKYYPGFVKTEEYSLFTQYDEKGKKLIQGEYHFEMKDRYWVTYYPDGKMKSQTPYSNGKITGVYKKWYANGKPLIEMECNGSAVVAQPKVWDDKGKAIKSGTKAYDELVESSKPGEVYNDPSRYKVDRTSQSGRVRFTPPTVIEEVEPPQEVMIGTMDQEGSDESPQVYVVEEAPREEAVLTFAEEMPEFPGGSDSLRAYLARSIKYPAICLEAGQQGTVYVRFVVNTDGTISNVDVVKGVAGAPDLSKEAIRVIKQMPKWKPGRMNGRAVRVYFTQPVKFVIK